MLLDADMRGGPLLLTCSSLFAVFAALACQRPVQMVVPVEDEDAIEEEEDDEDDEDDKETTKSSTANTCLGKAGLEFKGKDACTTCMSDDAACCEATIACFSGDAECGALHSCIAKCGGGTGGPGTPATPPTPGVR